jgi:hypothetical protein
MTKTDTTSRASGGYDPQRYARVIRPARSATPPEQRELTRQELIELAEKALWGDD